MGDSESQEDMIYTHQHARGAEIHRIVVIEYFDGKPSAVTTEHRWAHDSKSGIRGYYWDFEWCERDQSLYYHWSGSGPRVEATVGPFCSPSPPKADLWIADGIPLADYQEQPVDPFDLL